MKWKEALMVYLRMYSILFPQELRIIIKLSDHNRTSLLEQYRPFIIGVPFSSESATVFVITL
jgi:hypothetical protein